ncbi:hypothetical protein ABIB54_003607, partial [Frigoribacterium sp. UYMn621]
SEHATAEPEYFVDLTPTDDLDQNPV